MLSNEEYARPFSKGPLEAVSPLGGNQRSVTACRIEVRLGATQPTLNSFMVINFIHFFSSK